MFVDTILASLYRRVSMLKSARVSVYRPCRPGTGLLASLYRPCPPGTGLFASLYRPCPSGTGLLRTTSTALSDDDDDEDGEDEVSLNYLDADSDDDDEAEITGLDKLRLFAMQEGQRWPVTTPPPPTTSGFVKSRALIGCTDPIRRGCRRTPLVFSRFGSKLPHLC